jgi:ubiquinone/menaquinone biosynthesis C-methylase UbiE
MTGARVADLGCGEGAFANAIGRDVAAFDHVAEPSRSIAADLAALPLADASIDLAVLSLSLVGTKWADSLTEAARVVAPGGHVVVTELANGPRSPEAIAAVLAGCGWTGLRFLDRDPFIDIEAQRAE